jgi:dihydropyrimidinase
LFHIFSSDHAAFRFDDPKGKQLHGENASFSKIPNGIPGLETRMPLLFSEGVLTGRISLQQFVALTSANPAKMYGLYPRKGTIAVGSDADLVIWDHKKKVVIRNADLHHNVDYTPYEGMEITGWPETTFVRGQLVQHAGVLKATPGSGQFLPCGLPSHFGVNKVPDLLTAS